MDEELTFCPIVMANLCQDDLALAWLLVNFPAKDVSLHKKLEILFNSEVLDGDYQHVYQREYEAQHAGGFYLCHSHGPE